MRHKEIFKNIISRQKLLALALALLRVMTGIFPAVYVMVYASFVDAMIGVVSGNVFDEVVRYKIGIAILFTAIQLLCGAYASYLEQKLQLSIERVEKDCLMEKILHLRFLDMEDASVYQLVNHVKSGIPEKYYSYYNGILGVLNLILSVTSVMAVIIRYSWKLGFIALFSFVPVFYISIKGGKEDYSALSEYMEIARRTQSYEMMMAGESRAFERSIFPYFSWAKSKWRQSFDAGVSVYLGYKRKSYTRIKTMSILIKMVLCAIVGVIVYLTSKDRITVGICVILMQQVISLAQRVTWDMYMYLYWITSGVEYQKRYAEFYELREEEAAQDTIFDAEKIIFSDVSFRYSDNSPYVLRHLNLILEKGKHYAIVGENGAGKTTLMKILLGFYREYEGEIRVDGKELRSIYNEDKFISPVFQNFMKYQVSVRENLGMDLSENLTDEKITEWLEYFDLDFLKNIGEMGYDTPLGRLSGQNKDLSGGQWQKLAIIRALSRNTEWLILDEPTAALDPMAETSLYELFLKAMEEKTSVIITHRLGAARLADEVLVLQDGVIKEQGSHEILMQQKGIYEEMFESQRGWYQNAEA